MRWGALIGFWVASVAMAAPLSLEDGFEDPDGGFPLWTAVQLDAPNTLGTSTDFAFAGARSMKVVYAGDINASPRANTVLELDAGEPTLFVRFHLYVPASTVAAFPRSSWVRLLRVGDTPVVTGTPIAETQLWSDASGNLYLRLAYPGGGPGLGSVTATPVQSDRWLYVEHALEFGASRFRLFLGDAGVPVAETDGGVGMAPARSVRVGFPFGANATGTALTWYIDEVVVRDTGPIGPATETRSPADAGIEPRAPGNYRVGCGCDGSGSGVVALLALMLRASGRGRRRGRTPGTPTSQ